jgi:DNA invertase Pin-like site-specific DNA recombinase
MKKLNRPDQPTTEVRLAYPYLRYSGTEQAKGDSTRRQTAWHEEVCRQEGWQIDRSYEPLRDEGVSGFRGANLKADLGRFLRDIGTGRVRKGSILLAEELDRVSRQDRKDALPLIMGILSAGIDIRTRDRHYTEDSINNLGEFLDLTIRQGTGNEESRKKSVRIGELWRGWREKIAKGEKAPPPGRMPPWVRWNEQAKDFELVQPAADTIKLIFQWAGDGLGIRRILARLNDPKKPVPTIGRRPVWGHSYLGKLVCWDAVMGDFEDVDGVVYKGLYPAAVSEAEFYRARQALAKRQVGNPGVGRTGQGVPNLFQGLAVDAVTGSPLHLINKGRRQAERKLVSAAALNRAPGATAVSFPYPVFERCLLGELTELDVKQLLGEPNDGPDELTVLTAKVRRLDEAITLLVKDMDANGESPTLFKRLRQREAERKDTAKELTAARARAANPLAECWTECKSALQALHTATVKDRDAARLRCKAELRRVVDRIYCVTVQRGKDCRLMAVQVAFKEGPRRSYLLYHRAGGPQHRPRIWTLSRKAVKADDVNAYLAADLSNPAEAKKLADLFQSLAAADWQLFDDEAEEQPKRPA